MTADTEVIDIPKRALFRAAEVCELAGLQPYVLRSWEAEFPDLGVTRGGSAGRTYRRADVERVLRIKHLLFVEGLTLAGIRRRIEDEATPVADDLPIHELLGRNARERLAAIRGGLQGILDLLAGNGSAETKPALRLATPRTAARTPSPGSNGRRPMAHTRRAVAAKSHKPARRRKRH